MNQESIMKASKSEAAAIILTIITSISLSMIYFQTVPHIPIVISILLLFGFGIWKNISFKELQQGMTSGAASGLSAVFLFFFIGMLISAFIISGTIPTLMYSGLMMADWPFYFSIVFIVTALIGVSVGSSLTTTATLGVAFIGMSSSLDYSLPITAGAIVSGAFFGDKMSPLSDTTNLASTVVGVDLFDHIKNMAWTTVPAFILSLIAFGFLSPATEELISGEKLALLKNGLRDTGLIHWYSLLPIAGLLVMAIKRVPAMVSLALTILFSICLSYIHTYTSYQNLAAILMEGYIASTGIDEIDALLTRGGLQSMLFTVSLVLLALGLGGLLFKLGIINTLLSLMENTLKKSSTTLLSAAGTAFGINVAVGEQYLSILLAGESFKRPIDNLGLERKNLSRVLEDAGTVINPLVPWGVCGVFITSVLGVPTLEYLPFALFCLLCPILTIIFCLTGWTITYRTKEKSSLT
ncbi:Na+/H+ antiporter NhaC [Jeotgalibacillus campisalis]|uniref:Sodium:proton antiporter n=1 Tax=Jeotgalibacillus campisalis TaxID=220754 RepID=A0A0C2VST4_9BACL|nr:Na+/H+ antiporter NhaC [Jeotgalibacillus campisalis]KIL47491.1 sodium:proton antiporter [Jeotgalibacillus campisalis]